MPIDEQKRIFSKNLQRLLNNSGKTQAEVAKDIGVSPQTMNTWIRGIAIPRMGKIQKLANYFGVDKSQLIDDVESINKYYLNEETARIAQQIYDDPDLHALFDAARDSDPEDMKMAADLLKRLKKTNPDG